jgi:hypothetical protein
MMVAGALPSLADERAAHDRAVEVPAVVDVVDHRSDRIVDQPVDPRASAPVDEPAVDSVRPEVTDRPNDLVRDRETDRVRDRDRCVDFVNDRRCIDDRHPHVNIRHLIQRLINAGEWEKLFRLLHRLGII